MIVFLEKDYFKPKMIHGDPRCPEPNRIYFLSLHGNSKANELAANILAKLNTAIQNYKQNKNASTSMSESDKISLLKQYKELLDAGILTQEEFNSKKALLLHEEPATIRPIENKSTMQTDAVCCPKCGSTEFHSGKRGWNIWTGLLGSSKVIMTCLKCGHKWTPKDYKK